MLKVVKIIIWFFFFFFFENRWGKNVEWVMLVMSLAYGTVVGLEPTMRGGGTP
jgi:hypothetical protein